MTPAEHVAAAERLIKHAMLDDITAESGYEGELAAAQVHATLAQVGYLREIGDQLDTLPRRVASTLGRVQRANSL